jgi:uncharacterized protein
MTGEFLPLLIVLLAGLGCGFLNAVASSGSAVSLPLLMWVGLGASDANATNRIPVLFGSIAATLDLGRNGKIPWKLALKAGVPVTAGAALGAMLAEIIPEHDLEAAIVLAVLAALVLVLAKLRDILETAARGAVRFGRQPCSRCGCRWIFGLLVVVIVGELVHLASRHLLDAFG